MESFLAHQETDVGPFTEFVQRVLLATTTTSNTSSDAPDVAPPQVPFTIAAILILIVLILMACGSRNVDNSATTTTTIDDGGDDNLQIWTPQGNLSTTILVLACMIPSFLVLGGLQCNFNAIMMTVTMFPVSLVLIGAIQTYSKIQSLRAQYWRSKQGMVDDNEDHYTTDVRMAFLESNLRKFEVHTLFADPDEPLARVVLVGTSQIMLLGMYVWGLWDRGPPDFSDPRLYAYYYAGMFMLVAYIAGKLSADKEAHLKWFAHQWRQRQQRQAERKNSLGGDSNTAKLRAEPVNRPTGLFSSPTFWAFYFLGVNLYEEDFSWASEGEITIATLVLRYVLDAVVNTAGLFYIMVGLPIQVSHNSAPVDFVLTAVAAFYILEMDNAADVHVVEIPNFDHERRLVDTKDDAEDDAGANELLTILKELPSDVRARLGELINPSTPSAMYEYS